MKLRDLSDLDLAALVSVLHEATLGAVALQGFLSSACVSPWPMVRLVHSATRAAGAEAIARRAGAAGVDRLFAAEPELPLAELRELRRLMKAVAEQVRSQGFASVATLLEDRLSSEICVDVSGARTSGLELRTLN